MPQQQPIDIVALASLFATATTIGMQYTKPLLELIPGITLPQNQQAHDALLRIVQLAMNLVLLVVAARTPGSSPLFASYNWWDYLAVLLGQGVTSHVVYTLNRRGGATSFQNTKGMDDSTSPIPSTSPVPAVLQAEPAIPVVPRG